MTQKVMIKSNGHGISLVLSDQCSFLEVLAEVGQKLEEAKERGYSLATLGRWTYPHTKNITLLGERENEGVDWIVDFIVSECAKFDRKKIG